MLYDPKWETKSRRPSRKGFLAFAKRQTGTFNYNDIYNCACAQYFTACGITDGGNWWIHLNYSNKYNDYAKAAADLSRNTHRVPWAKLVQVLEG